MINLKRSFFLAAVCFIQLRARAAENSLSIYNVNPVQDGTIIGLSLAASGWAHINADSLIRKRCPCDPDELNSWDRQVVGNSNSSAARASDFGVTAAIVAPFVVTGMDTGFSEIFFEDAIIYAEVLAVNTTVLSATKYSVQRPRPKTYDGDPGYVNKADGYQSFYSGHVSTTFAALSAASTTLQIRHPEYGKWPWIVTGVVGVGVAYGRVADGQHFYTDVLTGALVGAAIGTSIPRLHLRRNELSDFKILPQGDGFWALWTGQF